MATGDITFALRSTSTDAFRSFNGKTGNKYAGTEDSEADASAIGGSRIDLGTNNPSLGARHSLVFSGGSNMPSTRGFSVLFRAKYTGDALALNSMFEVGAAGTETFHRWAFYYHHGAGVIGISLCDDIFGIRVDSSATWAIDADDYHDFVITDDGLATASSVKVYVDGVLIKTLSSASALPATRNRGLDHYISVGYCPSISITSSEWYVNEVAIIEGVIDPTNVTLEDPDTGATSTGSLDGPARTKWLHCLAFDGLQNTSPGEANVSNGVTWYHNGVLKTGIKDVTISTDPGASNVVSGVGYIIEDVNYVGTFVCPPPAPTPMAQGKSRILKQAFNMISKIHSRPGTLKRLGNPDIYSPARLTPSNFFRYLEGPSDTVIRGREFVIPIDTMLGQGRQTISFSSVPTEGTFHLMYGELNTAAIAHDDAAADVQTALRAVSGLEDVTVTGNFTDGFTVTFTGVETPLTLVAVQDDPPLDATISIASITGLLWNPLIKRGDRILDSVYGELTIDEIIEMSDIGGSIMGYRCRCE